MSTILDLAPLVSTLLILIGSLSVALFLFLLRQSNFRKLIVKFFVKKPLEEIKKEAVIYTVDLLFKYGFPTMRLRLEAELRPIVEETLIAMKMEALEYLGKEGKKARFVAKKHSKYIQDSVNRALELVKAQVQWMKQEIEELKTSFTNLQVFVTETLTEHNETVRRLEEEIKNHNKIFDKNREDIDELYRMIEHLQKQGGGLITRDELSKVWGMYEELSGKLNGVYKVLDTVEKRKR